MFLSNLQPRLLPSIARELGKGEGKGIFSKQTHRMVSPLMSHEEVYQ